MDDCHSNQPVWSAANEQGRPVIRGQADGISADVFVAALLRYASDAIAVSDRDSGRFVVVSDSYCALTGYTRDELVGRTSIEARAGGRSCQALPGSERR